MESLAALPVNVTLRDVAVLLPVLPEGLAGLIPPCGTKQKQQFIPLVEHVNATWQPGQVCAIMGGSGSGKTTLLNAIAGFIDDAYITGEVTATAVSPTSKGKDVNSESTALAPLSALALHSNARDLRHWRTKLLGYVTQQDHLLPFLTVRETLRYAAALRLRDRPTEEQHRMVENVILELGLKDCADTIIGDSATRGCSGGEKRRVTIGVQILTNPSVLLLDECTAGLDSFTSLAIMEMLSHLAKKFHKTIVVTLHQPRADIFALFDNLLLLSNGKVTYSGPAREAVLDYFSALGMPCPTHVNPADHILDMTSVDTRDEYNEVLSRQRVARLWQAWAEREASQAVSSGVAANANPLNSSEHKQDDATAPKEQQPRQLDDMNQDIIAVVDDAPAHTASGLTVRERVYQRVVKPTVHVLQETRILFSRSSLNLRRDLRYLVGTCVALVFIAIVVGLNYLQLQEDSLVDLNSRYIAIFQLYGLAGYTLFVVAIYRACVALQIMDRERQANMYGPIPFLLAEYFVQWPLYVFAITIYSIIAYHLCGLRDSIGSEHFWVFALGFFLYHLSSVSFAWMAAAHSRNFAVASLVANMHATWLSLTSGPFVHADTLPAYLSWFKPINFYWFTYRLLMNNEFQDREFDCPFDPAAPECGLFKGSRLLQDNGVPPGRTHPMVVLLYYWAIVLAIAALLLQVLKQRMSWKGTKALLQQHNERREKIMASLDAKLPTGDALGSVLSIAPSEVHVPASIDVTIHQLSVVLQREGKRHQANTRNAPPSDATMPPPSGSADVLLNITPAQSAAAASTEHGTRPLNIASDGGGDSSVAAGDLTILRDVTAKFPAGKLSVILGTSGAGKTELLNRITGMDAMVAGDNRYQVTGHVLFTNTLGLSSKAGGTADGSSLGKVGYVQQETSHLLPFLTVRETLRYAARLTLPPEWTKDQKHHVADEVLKKLNLAHCATTRIGNEWVRGISGGERRRVAIAIGLLTNPSVLVLDEPTTGLDAFMARGVIETLKALAKEGRTVICTIHSPRSDMYDCFDRLLVLSSGGTVVYEGLREAMLTYFDEQVGERCAPFVNPCDWVMDLAAVDLRNTVAEARTRSRVARLGASFRTFSVGRSDLEPPTSSAGSAVHPVKKARRHVIASTALQQTPAGARDTTGDVELDDMKTSTVTSPATAQTVNEANATSADVVPADLTAVLEHKQEDNLAVAAEHGVASDASAVVAPKELVTVPVPATDDGADDESEATSIIMAKPPRMLNVQEALPVVFRRSFTNFLRQPEMVISRFMQPISMGLILCLFFAPLGSDQYAVRNRTGCLMEIVVIVLTGMLNNIAFFPAERDLFLHEYAQRTYGAATFMVSYFLQEFPFFVLGPSFVLSLLMCGVVGLQFTAKMFFVLVLVSACLLTLGETYGIVICSLFSNPGVSVSMLSSLISIAIIMTPLYSLGKPLPVVLRQINYINPLSYVASAITMTEYDGLTFHCTPQQLLGDGSCPITTGEQAIALLGVGSQPLAESLGTLVMLTVLHRFAAYGLLRLSLFVRQRK